jgi:lysophospholipase L1-like esterase
MKKPADWAQPQSMPVKLLRALMAWSLVFVTWIVVVEIFLRCFYEIFPQAVRNHLATGYHSGFTGIYNYDPETGMNVMKPHFERKMYFNGYRWHHRTDWMGFRNPADRSHADVVLLGDSMLYGHGLEEAHTVRHELEEIIGRPVSNLGIQGGSVYQEYQILKRFALKLEPKFIFLFFLANDIHDLTVYLSDEKMRQFMSRGMEAVGNLEISRQSRVGMPILKLSQDLYVARAIYASWKLLSQHTTRSAAASAENWHSLSLFSENPRLALAMEFHLDALKKMYAIASGSNIAFVNAFIYTGLEHFAKEEPVYEKIIQDFCRSEGIPFLNLRKVLADQTEKGSALFLENDGHFSAQGARVIAEFLANYIEKSDSPLTAGLTSH